jgi:hypothetical protein
VLEVLEVWAVGTDSVPAGNGVMRPEYDAVDDDDADGDDDDDGDPDPDDDNPDADDDGADGLPPPRPIAKNCAFGARLIIDARRFDMAKKAAMAPISQMAWSLKPSVRNGWCAAAVTARAGRNRKEQ